MAWKEEREYDESMVTLESREFAGHLFNRFPQFRAIPAKMSRTTPDEPWNLHVDIPSHSDPGLLLTIWLESEGNDNEPSVAFGDWHTHERCLVYHEVAEQTPHAEFFDVIEKILTDKFIVAIGPGSSGATRLLDLTTSPANPLLGVFQRNTLIGRLKTRFSRKELTLRSWSGKHNRVVRLKDLQ